MRGAFFGMSKNQAVRRTVWRLAQHRQLSLTKILSVALLSVLLSRGEMLGGISPFSVAFVASLSGFEAAAGFLGSIAGYISSGGLSAALPRITAMLAVMVIRFVLEGILARKIRLAGLSVATASCVFALGIITGTDLAGAGDVVLLACEAVLAGAGAYFLMLTYRAVKTGTPFVTLSTVYITAIALVFTLGIAAAASTELWILNLGRIAGALCILFAAERYKQVGGALCGVLVTFGVMLHSPDIGQTTVMFALAGLVAGLFSPFGKFVQTVTFISANAIGLIVIGVSPSTVGVLADVMAATIAFTLLPARASSGIDITGKLAKRKSVELAYVMAARLRFAAGTLEDIKGSVDKVAKTMEKSAQGDASWIHTSTCEAVCKHCSLNTRCWQTHYGDTTQAMDEAIKTLRNQDTLDRDRLPEYLKRYCCRRDELAAMLNKYYREYISNQHAAAKLTQMRMLMAEQFCGMADLLSTMSGELAEVEEYDVETAQVVMDTLEKVGMLSASVCAQVDSCGRVRVEAFAKEMPCVSREALCEMLSDALGREFDPPQLYKVRGVVKLSMFERACYTLEVKASQISSGRSRVSGDSYEVFSDARGGTYLCLSDGMGSGRRAAVDSAMACSLLVKLLRASIGLDAALKLINSSLIVKSREESFATIDLCRVDLYSGLAELVKAGAAATFIRKGKAVASFESASLPIGMLGGTQLDRSRIRLSEGDIIVMVSDGVTAQGSDWIKQELEQNHILDVMELSAKIASEAKARLMGQHQDDITVLAAKLVRD